MRIYVFARVLGFIGVRAEGSFFRIAQRHARFGWPNAAKPQDATPTLRARRSAGMSFPLNGFAWVNHKLLRIASHQVDGAGLEIFAALYGKIIDRNS